ncbi:MAG: hypothetical protein E7070_01965 [Bacteroidales bacterium]|jgi:ABC-type dipeptide/oligopeptide/nickel transport system permease subunit|nr:hypothetical protein [Bacteroidales bacterium]
MMNLIRFLWLKERFNHLWTFLTIWLSCAMIIVLTCKAGNFKEKECMLFSALLAIVVLIIRIGKSADVFIDKSHILLPDNMLQKYLSLLLFNVPVTLAVSIAAYIFAVYSGVFVAENLGYCIGNPTDNLMLLWNWSSRHPLVPTIVLLACLTAFTLGIYIHGFAASGIVFWTIILSLQMAAYAGIGTEYEKTVIVALLTVAIALLPVSWLVFKRKRYDRILMRKTYFAFGEKQQISF